MSTNERLGEYQPTAKPFPTLNSPRPNSNVSFEKTRTSTGEKCRNPAWNCHIDTRRNVVRQPMTR
jgi:hypothetical protein